MITTFGELVLLIDIKQKIISSLNNLPEGALLELLGHIEMHRSKLEDDSSLACSELNGTAIARIMEKMAARNALSEIKDPSAWQREIRKDRPLPGR